MDLVNGNQSAVSNASKRIEVDLVGCSIDKYQHDDVPESVRESVVDFYHRNNNQAEDLMSLYNHTTNYIYAICKAILPFLITFHSGLLRDFSGPCRTAQHRHASAKPDTFIIQLFPVPGGVGGMRPGEAGKDQVLCGADWTAWGGHGHGREGPRRAKD